MKSLCLAAILVLPLSAHGQETTTITWDDVVRTAERWAEENLRGSENGDPAAIMEFLNGLQSELQGEYVLDLARLRSAAKAILPILESRRDTLPYAIWLKTRMDYLEVADELRVRIPAPAQGAATTGAVRPKPSAAREREIWLEKLLTRSWPEQARLHVSRLKPLFEQEKVPPELVWIAEVESSFDPTARSPAGAVGLFQLMPATAKQYGLKISPIDERMQPEPSAGAAARHLAYLHGRFQDWRLALAAYNAGEGRVQRLLDSRQAGTFDAIAPYLPAETQMYVPKVEATLVRREGVKLSQLAMPPGSNAAEPHLK